MLKTVLQEIDPDTEDSDVNIQATAIKFGEYASSIPQGFPLFFKSKPVTLQEQL